MTEEEKQQEIQRTIVLLANEYKQNANLKIIQIFHAVVVMIIALLTCKTESTFWDAFFLLAALVFVAFAYVFCYLCDSNCATATADTYINNWFPSDDLRNKAEAKSKDAQTCRSLALVFFAVSVFLVLISIFLTFELYRLPCGALTVGGIVLLYIAYKCASICFDLCKRTCSN